DFKGKYRQQKKDINVRTLTNHELNYNKIRSLKTSHKYLTRSALKDNLEIKTLHGILEHSLEQQEKEKPPKHFVEKITNSAAEATRDNIAYLKQAVGIPITDALKGLCGF